MNEIAVKDNVETSNSSSVLLIEIDSNINQTVQLDSSKNFSQFKELVLYYQNGEEDKLMIPPIRLGPDAIGGMYRYCFQSNSFVDFKIISNTSFSFINCRKYCLRKVYGIPN